MMFNGHELHLLFFNHKFVTVPIGMYCLFTIEFKFLVCSGRSERSKPGLQKDMNTDLFFCPDECHCNPSVHNKKLIGSKDNT